MDIEALIKICEKCQDHSRRNPKDPLLARGIPLVHWTLLEIDLSTCDDHSFLLVMTLSNESARSMINSLKCVYCDFRLPRRVLTDNGSSFRSQEFINFHAKLTISVEKSSAYNHQSVGSVKRMVQTIKLIMVKNIDNPLQIYRHSWSE